jgi:hypothetical protein
MAEVHVEGRNNLRTDPKTLTTESQYEKWQHWPINWNAIAVGALAAIAGLLIFGLIGVAVGAPLVGTEHRVVELKKIGIGALAFSIISSFLAFVIGGWIAGKIAGILRSEPGMLHGSIVWLAAVPVVVLVATLGAGSYLGGWYSGLASNQSANPPFDRVEPLGTNPTEAQRAEYRRELQDWNEETAKVTRNSALGAVSALLLGLVGSVIGGWMASGEPMTFTFHATRPANRTVPLYH